jgi:hypothetical protein
MIFTGEPNFPDSLAGNFYGYMDYDGPEVIEAARQLNISRTQLNRQQEELHCGVPYVIPSRQARDLAEAWLDAVDAFPPRSWIDIMHAFGLAAVKLKLKVTLTDMVDTNLRQTARARQPIIHYCYGDKKWEKRDYVDGKAQEVWSPQNNARKNTILGEIHSQLIAARKFYRSAF